MKRRKFASAPPPRSILRLRPRLPPPDLAAAPARSRVRTRPGLTAPPTRSHPARSHVVPPRPRSSPNPPPDLAYPNTADSVAAVHPAPHPVVGRPHVARRRPSVLLPIPVAACTPAPVAGRPHVARRGASQERQRSKGARCRGTKWTAAPRGRRPEREGSYNYDIESMDGGSGAGSVPPWRPQQQHNGSSEALLRYDGGGSTHEPLLRKHTMNTTSQIAIVGANVYPIESLDYEVVENDLFKQDWRSRKKKQIFQYIVLKWSLVLVIGLLTGLVGFLILQ